MDRTWWKEQVIYQIYPRSFKDSNGDGIGDLGGIIEKLDYLKDLGVDILWLSPIYQSPNDDNGYDISDYYNVMQEFGDHADFDIMLEGIHARGMKLVMDLVVNHTSDEHEWFQQARQSTDNPYRDFYFWKPEKPNNWQSFFSGDAWEYDSQTGEYYLHLFTRKQPDLNWENPKVRKEVFKMMRFWLDKGIDGFRMDVIPLVSKRLEFENADFTNFNKVIEEVYANGPRIHKFLNQMNKEVISKYDMMTVAEGVGIKPEQCNQYVGKNRKELHMLFHFGHMFIDHGKGGKFDIIPVSLKRFKHVFDEWDEAIGDDGWINIYLDNHDFPRMVSRFGNDGRFHDESAKLLATLILSLRGTPCIYQGSEIGMTNVAFDSFEDYKDVETLNALNEWKSQGKDPRDLLPRVHQQGRDNVRTPIQWDDSRHAGFTEGEPWIKVNPNYRKINVERNLQDPDSIFHFYKKMLQFRKLHLTLVYGQYQNLLQESEYLFVYKRWDDQFTYYIALNFSDDRQPLEGLPDEAELKLELCNYTEEKEGDLRPWEARIYKA